MLVVAWASASGTASLHQQVLWSVLGVMGLLTIGAAMLSLVSSGRRTVRVRRQRVVERLEQFLSHRSPGSVDDVALGSALVQVAGSSRYHRDDCLLVRGRDVTHLAEVGATDGRSACEMCKP